MNNDDLIHGFNKLVEYVAKKRVAANVLNKNWPVLCSFNPASYD